MDNFKKPDLLFAAQTFFTDFDVSYHVACRQLSCLHLSILNFVALIFTCKLTLVQSILPASIFYLAKTFLHLDEQYIKHIDLDLMNSGDVAHGGPLDLRRNSDHGGGALWCRIVTVILTFGTPRCT